MRKALVTIAEGQSYTNLEKCIGAFRRSYAERHDWEYIVVNESQNGIATSTSELWAKVNLSKLLLPARLSEFDLVAYMDCDSIVNPLAPCLSQYYDNIPPAGFAAAQTELFDQRLRVYPQWQRYHYDYIALKTGWQAIVKNPGIHINGGLLLFKPKEVRERWAEIAACNSDLRFNEEDRLNTFEVQSDKCFFLPSCWHVLWKYHRDTHYPFLAAQNLVEKALYKLTGYPFGNPIERYFLLITLQRNNFIHLAYEHHKIFAYFKGSTPERIVTTMNKAVGLLNPNIDAERWKIQLRKLGLLKTDL